MNFRFLCCCGRCLQRSFVGFLRCRHWYILFLIVCLITFVNYRFTEFDFETDTVENIERDEYGRRRRNLSPSLTEDLNPNRITNFINLRYWELINSSLAKTSKNDGFDQVLNALDSKVRDRDGTRYNLWRPRNISIDGRPVMDSDDRTLAQLLLVMEDFNKTLIGNFSKKTVFLRYPFPWWNKRDSAHCLEGCPQFNDKCVFVDSKTHRPRSGNTDAVIVKGDQWGSGRPRYANSGKMLVFYYSLEANVNGGAVLSQRTDILTSYWRGSGLVAPYGKWAYYNPAVKRQKQAKNYAEGKTKLVAAFISNCFPSNSRSEYITLLQQFITVDVYGSCGSFDCSQNTKEKCFEMLKKEYKFYLSFENANCRDYITEKFWMNALLHDVVPVVMGAHPDDYKVLAPANSYIHVEEFKRPKELATYLEYLDKNDEEYNKYFEWKGTGDFVNGLYFCRVCAMLLYAERSPPPRRTEAFNYGDLESNGMCLPRGQTYWTSASWALE